VVTKSDFLYAVIYISTCCSFHCSHLSFPEYRPDYTTTAASPWSREKDELNCYERVRFTRRKRKSTQALVQAETVQAEPIQAEPVRHRILDESNHPLDLPTLATIFESGRYVITRNLMSYLSQAEVEILKAASNGIDAQLHDNLHYIPPPQ
jgi:hypothetical protein